MDTLVEHLGCSGCPTRCRAMTWSSRVDRSCRIRNPDRPRAPGCRSSGLGDRCNRVNRSSQTPHTPRSERCNGRVARLVHSALSARSMRRTSHIRDRPRRGHKACRLRDADPGAVSFGPPDHFRLFIQMAIEQDGVFACARDIDGIPGCARATGRPQGWHRQGRELPPRPALEQRHRLIHIAVRRPVRVKGRRLVGDLMYSPGPGRCLAQH